MCHSLTWVTRLTTRPCV
ncbi:hypothetical protein F383_00272 [Gossypium arboreum]|uniref:Uncharacterized protein n=1 Tax=Gossypium arboreum TaxID=29729 RepID=A0A0B0MPC4_GOSAR|nr:hypothetical protein F383_25999 [Gossypium arboreum]KHG21389.1 hypothetical protein F383_08112 [Gossypium arboreum]KHG27579.1 hypothetical protein F383_10512 [Gossypium arboreum]KHG30656.1 hypothetical protein F383_00272 [Gossypium arboreum]